MTDKRKTVDGFRFLSPSLKSWIGNGIPDEKFSGDIPWTPMETLCSEANRVAGVPQVCGHSAGCRDRIPFWSARRQC
jgi:hypothetical protein